MLSITPHIAEKLSGEHQDKAVELLRLDATLNANIPQPLRLPLEELLRLVNSFYSNKIEGNPTLPSEVLRSQYSEENKRKSKGVNEILGHLEVQLKLKLIDLAQEDVYQPKFIKMIHREFYKEIPKEHRKILDEDGREALDDQGKVIYVEPGEFREHKVTVGKHIPPEPTEIKSAIDWFANAYDPSKIFGTSKLIAAICAHHRFAWIHPFMDGNGRVGRLLTDCHMKAAGLGGYGLWTMSRGFGRDTTAYYNALSAADQVRKGDLDGRGILSDSGLVNFTEYFIDTALGQVKFFTDLLSPQNLRLRIDSYFEFRTKSPLLGIDGNELPLLRIEARDIYRALLERGAMSRSEVYKYLGKGESTIRPVLDRMQKENLIDAPKRKDISVLLSPASIEFLFPQLW